MKNTPFYKSVLGQKYLLCLAFILPLLYWLYLALIAEMLIVHDSIGYEQLGSLLARHEWLEYFKGGPNREPLYPLTISLSMQIADLFSISYHAVQKIIQILIVLLTQFLALSLLRRLKIHPLLSAATILYLGFSPVIVNSIFNIYSEVITYPLVLGIILVNLKCADALVRVAHNPDPKNRWGLLASWACLLSGLFVLMTFVKASFEIITLVFLMMYVSQFVQALNRKNKKLAVSLVTFMVCFLSFYGGILIGYKFMNKIYNGQFVLTDRGASIFYGNTLRRVKPLTQQRLLVDLSYLPDPDGHFCQAHFGAEPCIFESYKQSDIIAFHKSVELQAQGFSINQINQIFFKNSFQEIFRHPFQYTFLTILESLRIFSWESTIPKFVVYPEWGEKIFGLSWLNRGLNFMMTVLTLLSLIYALFIFKIKSKNPADRQVLSTILWFIGAYIFAHAPFLVILRHILPIVPLYLILTAFFVQKVY